MIRQTARSAIVLTAIGLVLGAAAAQPPAALDRIVVRDKDKKDGSTKNLDGILKFAPVGFQVTAADGKVLAVVSPADVIKVIPGELPGVDRNAKLAPLLALEDRKTLKDIEAARQGYVALLKEVGGSAPAKSKEFLAFKKVQLGTRLLDEAEDEDWAKQADSVVKEWEDFLAEYRTGWEIWPAARAIGRLYVETNKYTEAERLWKRLSGKDFELPADLKAEAALQMIDAQIRSGAYASAATAAEAEAKNAALGPAAKDKLALYALVAKAGDTASNPAAAAAAIKEIEGKIAASRDAGVRAVGYSMIGELYLAAKRYREAMWAFMWVETVYNTDKDEVLKAVVRLGQVFKAQADDDHEKQYREKVRRMRAQL